MKHTIHKAIPPRHGASPERLQWHDGGRNTAMTKGRGPARKAGPDEEILSAVSSALKWITTLPEGSVKVTVHAGRVTLDGNVGSDQARETLEKVIRALPGVRDVANLLLSDHTEDSRPAQGYPGQQAAPFTIASLEAQNLWFPVFPGSD